MDNEISQILTMDIWIRGWMLEVFLNVCVYLLLLAARLSLDFGNVVLEFLQVFTLFLDFLPQLQEFLILALANGEILIGFFALGESILLAAESGSTGVSLAHGAC